MKKPKVVTICGSTRFADLHAIKRWEFERTGEWIGLMINYFPPWYAEKQGWEGNDHFAEQAGIRKDMDELHFRKIDISDLVYVINKDGYIGDSTRNEINYAKKIGKPVEYMEPKGE